MNQTQNRIISASEFKVDFYLEKDLDQLARELKKSKSLDLYSFQGRPFQGVCCLLADDTDIVHVKDLEDVCALTKVNYPLHKMVWLNNHFQQILSEDDAQVGNPEWEKDHVFTFPRGDYSPEIVMYYAEGLIHLDLNLGSSFELPSGVVTVPPKTFGEGVLSGINRARSIFSYIPQLKNTDLARKYERQHETNKKWFQQEFT